MRAVVAGIRADLCRRCPTPCAAAAEPAFLADLCAVCPLEPPTWGQFDCVPSAPPEPPLPPLATRALNFGRQALDEAAARLRGVPATSEIEAARRMAICRENKCGQFRKSDETCADCGCPMGRKAPWRSARCPRGLW